MNEDAVLTAVYEPHAVAYFRHKIDTLASAIKQIWGHTADSIPMIEACDRALSDLRDIQDRRGMSVLIVPVLGNKNAGKTTFCRSLLTNSPAREQLRTGIHRGDATTKLTWIGPTRPERIDDSAEAWISVSAADMFNAGAPYMLVDVPGFNDAQPSARAAAQRILPMAAVVVLVASWESGLEIDSLRSYLALGGGATIIPVVVDNAFGKRAETEVAAELKLFQEHLRSASPESHIEIPLHTPRIDCMAPEDRERMQELALERIHLALGKVLALPRADNEHLARIRYEHLLDELHRRMAPFLNRVEPSLERLIKEEDEALREVVHELLGSRQQLAAGIRTRLMLRAAQQCSPHWFPFRSFLSLLALTVGAWDRLVLALSGSLPSLALVLFQTGRNVKLLQQRQETMRKALLSRVEVTLKGKIADPYRIFIRTVREAVSVSPMHGEKPIPDYNLRGLSTLESEGHKIIEKHIESTLPQPKLLGAIGAVSTATWIVLAFGPLWAIYAQFLNALGAIFSQSVAPTWTAFPAPTLSMLFVTLLLVFLPVFLFAMLGLALTVNTRLVSVCTDQITLETREKFGHLLEIGLVGSTSDLALRQSVQLLRDEIRPKH